MTESWVAILMSLTALATAWSAYQANVWNGVQVSKLADAQDSQTLESQAILEANQHRMMDGIVAMTIMSALAEGRVGTIDFLVPRLREEFRKPLQDWMAGDPMHNTALPALPLQMPDYIEKVIKRFTAEQNALHAAYVQNMNTAQQGGTTSDNYVLMTVMFAIVLFFSGIASTFRSTRIETTLLFLGTVLLIFTLAKLATFPVSLD